MGFRGNDRKGTGFTNINRVLQANQGNRLGGAVTSGVQSAAQNVKTQAQKSQEKFQQEAQKNRLDTEEAKGKRDEIIGRFGTPASGASQTSTAPQQNAAVSGTNQVANQVAQANAQPTSGASQAPAPIVSEDEIKDFTRFRTGTYAGPTGLEDYQTLAGQAAEAEQLGNLTRSTGGRQELLRRTVGGEDYSQGQQRLDTLLLGQSGTQGLNQARKATRGLESDVQAANQQAGNLAQEYANRAKIFGEETVGKLQGARDPLSKQIDERLSQLQKEEADRQGFFNKLQGTFAGTAEGTKGFDRLARLGLGLQSAMDAGYLTQDQANQLLGEGGLISRAEQLGLDTNALLNERIKDIAAQNLNRGGAASADMEARISGLDRLLGKTGTDVEFGQAGADYVKGGLGFNLDSLGDYITKSEREKAQKDAKYAAELEARNARYLNQAQNYMQNSLGNAAGALGNVLGSDTATVGGLSGAGAVAGANLASAVAGGGASAGLGTAGLAAVPAMVGFDMATGGDTTAQTGNMIAQSGISNLGAQAQAKNAILEGLLKLNIGGKSLADNEAGKQLLKAIDYTSKLENQAASEASMAANEIAGEYGAMTRDFRKDPSRYLDFTSSAGASVLAPTVERVLGNVGMGDVGKHLGNVVTAPSNIAKSIGSTAKKTVSKLKKKAKKLFSDENLKENIKPAENKLYELLEKLNAHEYDYKKEVGEPGKHISVMAQELEESDLGKDAVEEHEMGKMVDYDKLAPVQLAAISSLHKRIKKLEGKE